MKALHISGATYVIRATTSLGPVEPFTRTYTGCDDKDLPEVAGSEDERLAASR
jgi:hypothetical protein